MTEKKTRMFLEQLKKKLIYAFLGFFMSVCIFFPVDQYNFKFIFFIIICALSIGALTNSFSKRKYMEIIPIAIFFPVLTAIISILNTGSIFAAISRAYVPILLLLVIPIDYYELDYKKILMNLLTIEAIIIVGIVLLDLSGIIDVNKDNAITNFIYKWDIGFIGKSEAFSFYYKIFLRTSPLIVFLLDDSWSRRKWHMVGLSILALSLSGTRANAFICLLYVAWRLAFKTFKKKKYQALMFALMLGIAIIAIPYVLSIVQRMMSATQSVSSDSIKTNQIQGLIEAIEDPFTLLFGAGFGSTFYDYGRKSFEVDAELAYFNLLRQIGLVMFLWFMIFLFKPLLKKIESNVKIIYLGYLAIAFTNPLLFSSTAFLAYIYIQIELVRVKEQRQEEFKEDKEIIDSLQNTISQEKECEL